MREADLGMMRVPEKQELLNEINAAFADCRRPAEFVNAAHCEECAEHNETLTNTNRDEISLKELGMAGWDPMCFVKPAGFLYYFPAMVRLAFDDRSDNVYLGQLLFHCTYEGVESRFFKHFNASQVKVTADLMRFFKYNWQRKIYLHGLTDDVDRAVAIWENLERQACERR
ncbi:hypothetical protein [Cerasicoccus maritimus]|uniref:hypothetical protein n=1 Tax=Cerasicoccus maritimus TaxID=490089 RepID=UPI002852A688|nr:hypothetical protein [Cerasicoccus maritimus]